MTSTLHSPDYRVFVEKLASLRKDAGVTQVELAAKLQKPQSYVSKYERLERRLDVAEFRLIVLALDNDPAEIFTEVSGCLTG
jgi:transcriptional regulator with XRE-family HTH domain